MPPGMDHLQAAHDGGWRVSCVRELRVAGVALILTASLCGQARAADAISGRLFYTPAERARMDRGTGADTPARYVPRRVATPSPVTGYVQRVGGGATVWQGGEVRYQPDAQPLQPALVSTPSGLAIRPSSSP